MNRCRTNLLLFVAVVTVLMMILYFHGTAGNNRRKVLEYDEDNRSTRHKRMRNGDHRPLRMKISTHRKMAVQPPHQHVYYLKTHKTGSTTMYAILAEYTISNHLLPILSNGQHFSQAGRFQPTQIMMKDEIKTFDTMFTHHIYSPKVLKFLHNDTYRVTTLREPYDNFVSAFLYYRNRWHREYLMKVPTDDPLTEYLRHVEKYETQLPGYSYTNNRQSVDMGYDLEKGLNCSETIAQFVELSDCRFDLVIIMEYFDEGLVMMKRDLRWKMEDIIYLTKNVGGYQYKKDITKLEIERRELHAKYSQADIKLYNHFLERFKMRREKEIRLDEEVAYFRTILVQFNVYCEKVKRSDKPLIISAGEWADEFQITRQKCKMASLDFKKMNILLHEKLKSVTDDNSDNS